MNFKDFIIILFVCLLWGLDYIFAKEALEKLNPLFFSSIRFLIVGIALFPFIKKRIPPAIPQLFIAGFMLVVVSYGANDAANKFNDSTMVSGTLGQLDAIIAIVSGYFILKERTTKAAIICIIFATLGIFVMGFGNVFLSTEVVKNAETTINYKNLISMAIILFGLVGWSGYILFTKKIEDKMSSIEIIAWTSIFGAFQCFLVALIFEGISGFKNDISNINTGVLFNLLYSGALGILVPNLLWHLLMKNYDVSKLNTFVLITPVVTILGSIFILNQEMNPFILLGIFMIIGGIFFANFFSTKSEKMAKT